MKLGFNRLGVDNTVVWKQLHGVQRKLPPTGQPV